MYGLVPLKNNNSADKQTPIQQTGSAPVSCVMFSNTWRTPPCEVLCFLRLGVRTPVPCYARQYSSSFCFVVLRFLTLGVCTRVPNYVFQYMAYAPLSRLMPANTSTAFVMWCDAFQHLAYAPLSRVARQYFINFCACSVV